MKILPVRKIENNTYFTTLTPAEWGTSTATAEAELEMLGDFPQTLRFADIDFTAKFIVTDGLPVISDVASAVEVKLVNLTNKVFPVNEELKIEFSVDSNKIPASEVNSILTTPLLAAQAKVILFETKVMAKLKELMDNARANVNNFSDAVEQTL